ncbi:MAG: hypothetical protein ACE5KT_11320 [Methanosarcinales archaeon]
MEREKILEIIRKIVEEEYGADRIKEIEAFGPFEGEDLDVKIYVKEIEKYKDTHKVWTKLFDTLYDLDLDVPFIIIKA